ncbi:hypothetical protein BC938DRAFT_480285 [Jimgerdemannia flammicorona]|uniref:Uncharacterized protein n=1 Tax=Jimgerdemannia flammicorona TaxID=994334 RepID=A0A433QJ31_9FUNG|nr:hypothetical protein BC938DRAFT_480285 [Jimgerdemannia flammicorona]
MTAGRSFVTMSVTLIGVPAPIATAMDVGSATFESCETMTPAAVAGIVWACLEHYVIVVFFSACQTDSLFLGDRRDASKTIIGLDDLNGWAPITSKVFSRKGQKCQVLAAAPVGRSSLTGILRGLHSSHRVRVGGGT